MMGGSETVSGDKDGVQTTEIHIPIGWQRRLEGGQVIYISPTGTALSSLDEVKTYLLTDGTCKCGLECPLVIQKVFNFSVGVKVEQHNQLQSKAEQDMTKLCNHRRKVVAMAALCRSMQASQLPFAALHHPEVHSGTTDHRDPKRMRVDREEEERGTYPPKLHPAPGRGHSTGPRASPQLVYPYNGSSPLGHMGGNSHHPLDALRRLQHPPPALSASSSSNASPSSPYPNSAPQRSPRTPTPQNLSQGPRSTPKTPETPTSPRVGPLSPLPSSPVTLSGRPSHGVIVSGSPLSLSPSPSPSPSINTMNCVSPHQRSRHPSASSSLSEQVGGGGDGGGGPLGCNFPQRRKSSSSSPHSPLPGGSPKPSHHFPKYKLEDILEQFKNSGNASTNNNHHIPVLAPMYPSLISNQSGGHPHVLSLALDKAGNLKTLKANAGPANTGALSFGLSAAGPSGLPLGPFLNHHHQSKPPHPASFPASSLLSAAAKAQLASQVTHGQSSNSGSSSASSASPLEVLKETQQQVTNSTLHNKQPPSPISTTRHPPPHPSLLFPPSHPLATSLHHHHPPTTERNASHRKRQRRSPTVLSMLRDTQQLTNGPRRTPPGDAISAAIINLSSSSSSFPTSSTSAIQNRNATIVENHFSLLPGPIPRLPIPHSGPARQLEALDFTTGLTAATRPPLGLDPPTQPLSALLHLLSVQNAQASAAVHSTSAQLGSVSRQSPRPPAPHSTVRPTQTPSPRRTNNATPLRSSPQPLSPPSLSSQSRSLQSPSRTLSAKTSPVQRLSPPSRMTTNSHLAPTGGGSGGRSHSSSPSSSVKNYPIHGHIPTWDTLSRAPSRESSQQVSAATEMGSSVDLSHSQGGVTMVTSTSPKPLDLSNHVLALLAASSGAPQGEGSLSDRTTGATVAPTGNTTEPVEGVCADLETPTVAKPPEANSHASSLSNFCPNGDNSPPTGPSALGDNTTPLSLAEAFPFMNQEQLLQLLSTTGGLPSILDPAVLASLPLGGLWLGGQQGQISTSPATPQLPQNPQDHHQSPEQPQELLMQQQEGPPSNQDHPQKQQISNNPLFPLLPSLVGTHGELPLNLLGLLNPLPPPVASTPTPGQEADLGLAEKPSLQALLMASLLLGQQQAAMLPLSALGQLSLEVPLQQPQLEGLPLDKSSGLLDPSALPGPGILEVLQGLLPPPSAAEGSLQALQSLLLHTPLSPTHGAFLSLSPALLTAALGSAELHPPPSTQLGPAQQTQQTPPQVSSDPGVDTLIPLSLQGKDHPLLQQLLPNLLNPTVLGDLSALAGFHNMVGLGASALLLPPVQASALGMPLLHGPDGAINLLNNLQLNITPPSEGDKPIVLQETRSPAPQEDIPVRLTPQQVAPSPVPSPALEPTPPPQRRSEGGSVGGGGVIDPYTSFMDTIYTSFLQVSAKEQEEGAQSAPTYPTSPFCALPPVSFPVERPAPSATLPQASAPVSLSPQRACSLRNPDLSRLSLEAAARSPAQGTPKPSEDGASSPVQRKPLMAEGPTPPEPPLLPIYLEEAKTDCAGPYGEGGAERRGALPQTGGFRSPRDGGNGGPQEENTGAPLHTEQGRDQGGPTVGARRGRKRKQTLQNVLEDFRDMDATALEDTKPTEVLLKPERSVRGRRRRGARSQRQ